MSCEIMVWPLFPMDTLFGQGQVEFLRLFSAPVTECGRVPFVFLLIHADFSLPPGVEKIVPVLRCVPWIYHFRIVTNHIVNIVKSRPITVRIFELLRVG